MKKKYQKKQINSKDFQLLRSYEQITDKNPKLQECINRIAIRLNIQEKLF